MDYQHALKFVLKDPEWFKKLCIALVVFLIPILNFAWYGYVLETARRASKKDDRLPEWNQLETFFKEGFRFAIGRWIYFLPVTLISLAILYVVIQFYFSVLGIADTAVDMYVALFIMVGGSLLIFGYSLLFQLVHPEIVVNFLRYNRFSAMFDLTEMYRLFLSARSDFLKASGFSIAMIIFGSLIGSGMNIFFSVLPIIGSMIALLGAYLVRIWSQLVTFHLYGQLYGELLPPNDISIETPPAD